jgi:GAF domain-containing protein
MSQASQEGQPISSRNRPHPVRFGELLHRLFATPSQGFLRLNFLQMAGGAILEFLGCDLLEVRLEEAGKVYRCRATVGQGVSRFICAGPTLSPGPAEQPGIDPQGRPITDQIMDSVLRGRFLAPPPFSTRGGSFWTGDATRPVLIRENGRADAQARSLVIGGDYPSLAFIPVPVDERIRGILHLGSRKAERFTREDIQFFETVGETLGVAVAFQAAQWALRERVKELDCLYGIAQVAQRAGLSLDEQLRGIVELLPPAWQYPDLTEARIILDGRAFATRGFQETPWPQEAPLRVGDQLRGSLRVVYTQEMPLFDEGPFLREERSLIDELARQVGLIVARRESGADRA